MPIQPNPNHYGNYLRVRGEYLLIVAVVLTGVELPPRARRIQDHRRGAGQRRRTTSACAENTPFESMCHLARRELPPRARRIQFD